MGSKDWKRLRGEWVNAARSAGPDFEMALGGEEAAQGGVYLCGLFLDGCRWDKAGNKLADSAPKMLYAPLPVHYVIDVLESDKKTGDAGFSFNAPCYKSPKRTYPNFIFAVDLVRTEEPPSKWVLRGVCLLTMKD